MYNIGNIVNNIVITLYGDRWLLDLSWYSNSNPSYINVKLLCCIPKTNMILYVNYTSIFKKVII